MQSQFFSCERVRFGYVLRMSATKRKQTTQQPPALRAISLRVSPALHRSLSALAESERRSLTATATIAIEKGLAKIKSSES